MQFELSDEERLLQDTVADFGRAHFGGANAPRSPEAEWKFSWDELTKLGLTGILVPERLGGAGGTLLDACLVAEQLGRSEAWIPFAGNSIAAASALAAAGQDADLTRLAEGKIYSLLVDERLRWPTAAPVLALDWRDGARGVLAAGGDTVDVMDLAAEGITVDGVVATDPLHPAAHVGGLVPRESAPPGPALRHALAAGRVGFAAWLTGVASTALDQAVAYSKEREQFGVPIGSFQAVQHLCADMVVDVETARSVSYGAAWTVANRPLAEAERSAAAAKSWCSRAAVRVCENSIQVLGGIGVTWEHPAHLRLRTAHQFGAALGGPRELDRAIAAGQVRQARDVHDGSPSGAH
jgi:alkylation response protein AidB-like acyl-CoA dehydrogenase